MKLTVQEYLDAEGNSPYRDWLETLDRSARARIQARVLRFELGNLGDYKSVGGGVLEARFSFGPGYRLYFGRTGPYLILLLLGGDKSTQGRDIREAQLCWAEFLEALKNGET